MSNYVRTLDGVEPEEVVKAGAKSGVSVTYEQGDGGFYRIRLEGPRAAVEKIVAEQWQA